MKKENRKGIICIKDTNIPLLMDEKKIIER